MNMNTSTERTNESLTIAGCLDAILKNIDTIDISVDDEDGSIEVLTPKAEFDYIRQTLDLNPVQAEIFAAIMELGFSGDATADRVARRMKVSNLKFLSLRPEIDALISKRYIRCSKAGRKISFRVPESAIEAIQRNERPTGEDLKNLSTTGMLRRIESCFREFWREEYDVDTLVSEISDIIRSNPGNTMVEGCVKYGISDMPDYELLLFLYMAVRRTHFQEEEFGWENFGKLFTDSIWEDIMHRGIEQGDLELFRKGVIENANNEGIVDNSKVVFNENVINTILADMCTGRAVTSSCRNLVGCSGITEKKMFYNSDVDTQVCTFASLLKQENYDGVVSRLKEKGFRSGLCALFYGGPGTGKTESVFQIARMTGRDIFMVDMSQLRSKWVGDSEKNIRALFQEYRRLVRNYDLAPIMLFNEADAVFGVRKKGAEDSVDKMNNTIQNILLQEMESLEGILIATTNLTDNLDSAFQRRFLYKIHFEKPGMEARTHIWENTIDGISQETAEVLARDYDFSGGQIENISRKATVDYILTGLQPGLDSLRDLCRRETMEGTENRTRIGF